MTAAGRAGRIRHPAVAAVYDAAVEGDTAYVVRARVAGRPLSAVLAEGPLPPEAALALTQTLAEVLVAAERVGVGHGRLHPGNVVLAQDGGVVVTDAETAAAADPVLPGDRPARDVAAVGQLLYAALTARWPGGPAHGLPAAPVASGRVRGPRQLRAAVPRRLDALARDLLAAEQPTAAVRDPRALSAAVAACSEGSAAEPTAAPRPTGRSRWARLGVPAAVVIAVASVGSLAGLVVFTDATVGARFPSLSTPERTAPVSPDAAAVNIAAVRDVDPMGQDGREGAGRVRLAHDGDPATAWRTDTYRGNPTFGGLKTGVGLVVDLGSAVTPSTVRVTLERPGAAIELRPSAGPDGLANSSVAAGATGAGAVARLVGEVEGRVVTFRPPGSVSSRYWLVWITSLPRSGDGYRAGIAELSFTR